MPPGQRVVLNNPKMLEWARQEINLTRKNVADHFHKEPEVIEAWEEGDDAPTFRQLCDLANFYKRSVATFFLPTVPPSSPKPTDFRMLPDSVNGTYSRELLIAYREMGNLLKDLRNILVDLEINLAFSLPRWTLRANVEEKAAEVRALLGVSVDTQIEELDTHYKALDTWRSVLFDHGVLASVFRMPITDARAFCLFENDLGGVGLSNEDREHGRIFSLFHEVCHLSLNEPGVSGVQNQAGGRSRQVEDYCDRFSAALLLPQDHHRIIEGLHYFSLDPSYARGTQIANKFKVSKYVVARRTLDLEMISENVYWEAMTIWKSADNDYRTRRTENDQTGGGNYHATQVSYIGKRFVSLLMKAFRNGLITASDVKRVVGIEPIAVESLGI